ncbi:hypothetical protein CRUP_036022, partial [Coryphaenoides rupestris]
VGMFKIHPEIPDSMSLEAKAFILRCFEPNPDRRATALDLLTDEFLTVTSRKKKGKSSFTGGSDSRLGVSLPVPVVVEDTSSSSEYGSVSPDNELNTNPFIFKPSTKCYSERDVKGPRLLFLSIPVENFEDHSAPPSPDEKDSGRKNPESFSSGDGGALWSSKFSTGMLHGQTHMKTSLLSLSPGFHSRGIPLRLGPVKFKCVTVGCSEKRLTHIPD